MSTLINSEMLVAVRNQRNLSQQALADKSGVGIATIKRIESRDGPYKSNAVTAQRLCQALGVTQDDLSMDQFERIVDIGGDVELVLDRHNDIASLREDFDRILDLVELRNRILRR